MNDTKVKVNFSPPADDGGETIDHYVIRFYDKNTGQFIESISLCNGADPTVVTN